MTDNVENKAGADGVFGVVISKGEVLQVSVNDAALEGLNVVIIEDDAADKIMRTGLDDNITTYMVAAREKNAKRGTALVSELAGAHLIEISKTTFSSSQEMAQEMADALDHAVFLLNKARSGDLPADDIQVPTINSEVAPASIEVAPATSEMVPATSEMVPAVNEGVPATNDVMPAISEVVPAIGQVELAAPEITEQPSAEMAAQPADARRRTRLYPSW